MGAPCYVTRDACDVSLHGVRVLSVFPASSLLPACSLSCVVVCLATYALLAQLKLLSTALFSVCLLRRTLSGAQLRALLLLFIGITLVLQAGTPQQQQQAAQEKERNNDAWWIGATCAVTVAMLSGFGGCYMEVRQRDAQGAARGTDPVVRMHEGQAVISSLLPHVIAPSVLAPVLSLDAPETCPSSCICSLYLCSCRCSYHPHPLGSQRVSVSVGSRLRSLLTRVAPVGA